MKKLVYLLNVLLVIVLVSCGETPKNENKESKKEKVEVAEKKASCIYTYTPSETQIYWTAFKLSDKVKVFGRLDSFLINGTKPAASMVEAISTSKFEIQTESVNSNDPVRDAKLAKIFFGGMEGNTISGKIISTTNSQAIVEITMNAQSKEVAMTVVEKEEKLELNGTINMLDWGIDNAFKAINEACSEKHTGPDGVNKLWEEVEIAIHSKFTKVCE